MRNSIIILAAAVALVGTVSCRFDGATAVQGRRDDLSADGAVFHIATDGNDANAGTKSEPFATLERARDAIRTLRQDNPAALREGATVLLRKGVYPGKASFVLDASDSGGKDAPVHYSA